MSIETRPNSRQFELSQQLTEPESAPPVAIAANQPAAGAPDAGPDPVSQPGPVADALHWRHAATAAAWPRPAHHRPDGQRVAPLLDYLQLIGGLGGAQLAPPDTGGRRTMELGAGDNQHTGVAPLDLWIDTLRRV